MISYRRVYELIDLRRHDPQRPDLFPMATLATGDGKLIIQTLNWVSIVFDLPDEDEDAAEIFEEDPNTNQVIFYTDAGRIVLQPLTLDRYHRYVRPFIETSVPEFKTEGALQQYWFKEVAYPAR